MRVDPTVNYVGTVGAFDRPNPRKQEIELEIDVEDNTALFRPKDEHRESDNEWIRTDKVIQPTDYQ